MNRTFTIALLLTAFLVGGLPGCGSSNPCDPLPGLPALFTLLDALAGTEVTVVGFITVDPGTFESSTGEVGFAIQEFENCHGTAAVYIQIDPGLGLDLSPFGLGDRVEVTGIVGDLDKLITLTVDEIADITLLSGGFVFFPALLDTVQVDETVDNPDREAFIVGLTGDIVVDPEGSGNTVVRDEDPGGTLFGWKIWLDDGSGLARTFWHPTANMDPELLGFLTRGAPLRVNGFLNRHNDEYEVFPRGNFDVSIPIGSARGFSDGEEVLVRGLIGLGPGSLATEGDFGFSLQEDNGDGTQDGIFVSIASNAIVVNNYAGNPMSFSDLIAAVNLGNRRVHISGVLSTTAGGDRVISAGDGDIRLISESISFPPNINVFTGAVSGNLGSWLNTGGTIVAPPPGAPLGTFSGWTIGLGGFRARINDSTGPVNVLYPFEIFGDQDNDGDVDFNDFVLAQVTGVFNFDEFVGGSLLVSGFARNRDGETEIVIPFQTFID